MAGITGQGTTFNLPNFVGELFAATPADTPFLSSIGGLTGGRPADAYLFQWQGYDLRAADKNRQRVEGDSAQTAEERVRFNVTNVVEVHQETVETSYTKQAATGAFASTGSTHTGAVGISGSNPVLDEHDWQVEQSLKQIARDVERGFLNGRFANPATNASPRKTRSMMEATTTNVSDQGTLVGDGSSTFIADGTITEATHGLSVNDTVTVKALSGDAVAALEEDWLYYVVAAPDANTFQIASSQGGTAITFAGTSGTVDVYTTAELTKPMLFDLMQSVYDNGGIMESETATIITNSSLKRALTKLFITDSNYQEESRNIGGVRVTTIETDFGVVNVMLDRHQPSAALLVASLEQCAPRFLPIPGKGFLFEEPLGKDGASDKTQIYGEIGLEYGNEKTHGTVLAVHKNAAA